MKNKDENEDEIWMKMMRWNGWDENGWDEMDEMKMKIKIKRK